MSDVSAQTAATPPPPAALNGSPAGSMSALAAIHAESVTLAVVSGANEETEFAEFQAAEASYERVGELDAVCEEEDAEATEQGSYSSSSHLQQSGDYDDIGAGEGDEAADDAEPALPAEQVDAIIASELRRFEREYDDTVGLRRDASPMDRPLPAGLTPAKAEKLVQLRRALAVSRAAAVHAADLTMTLAPGADEFPDDYDALQSADTPAAFDPFPAAGTAAAVAAAAGMQTATGSAAAAGASSSPAPLSAAPAPIISEPPSTRRHVSPLPDATVSSIREIMARVKVTPRPPGAWAEKVVQAAIARSAHHSATPPAAGVRSSAK